MKKAQQIRSEFLDYFKGKGHAVVESSGLVPHNDPTLMFTSAGMVQFKDCFLGSEVRSYQRAVSAQKCLRAGGKHNDLENVGFTARHHTFFEMLGNFSFGDYFKKDAIHFGWEFVTKSLGLPKDKLYVTVFETDDEAAEIWHKQEGVPRDHIYRFGEKDNFWSAGDTGPCGPCSEIFVDRGEKYGTSPKDVMGGDGDRFMEIWNLVFMQYERDASGKLNPLARPSIDTGAGLERLTSVIQDVDTNYDIDLFQQIIASVSEYSGVKYRADRKVNSAADFSMRVIADHCRATNFLMADGVLPSNEGRGYVLRRIMRRAIRHGRNLGFREPFFHKLTKSLINEMGSVYPELKDKREFLESNIKLEEERFLATLENGLKVLEDSFESAHHRIIPGDVAFRLYDTFGFPLDLTVVIAREKGLEIDHQGFNKAMETQRSRSRESWKGSGEEAVSEVYKVLQRKGLHTKFSGYDSLQCKGQILAIIENGAEATVSKGQRFQIVVDQTPFYAESGGQSGDRGNIMSSGGDFEAIVTDAQKHFGDLIVIQCENARGTIKVGATVQQATDPKIRALTAKNHTATHLLHHALRKFLGTHVKQAGSLVNADLLRFDFSHTKALTGLEIETVENFINEKITLAEGVRNEELDKAKALEKGAIAFFGDKYGDLVRVVSVGPPEEAYSVELCGGTHVKNSSEIQNFKIISETGIASGVRRIVALTGPRVSELLRTREHQLQKLMETLKATSAEDLLIRIEKLLASEKELRQTLGAQSRQSAAGEIDQWIAQAIDCGAGRGQLICGIVPPPDESLGANVGNFLRDLADSIRSKVQNSVVALGTHDKSKDQAVLLVAVTKDLQNKFKAGDLVKAVAPLFDGKGGGKPDLAQAGGKDPSKFPLIFAALEKQMKES